MKRTFYLFGILILICSLLSCASLPKEEITLGPGAIEIPGNISWTKTAVEVLPEEYIHIVAQGKVEITKWSFMGRDYDYIVGPEGTYNFSEKVKDMQFPLAAAEAGPSPCYALIGKIGETGEPFLVGREVAIKAPQGGTLFLGINDFAVTDNRGSFYARVERHKALPPELVTKDTRKVEEGKDTVVSPVEDARVLIIYLDGVRYDVLKEMAYKGYLPNIKRHFFDNGVDVVNSFTVFPSTTFTSTACFLTGCFNDLTGIKSDVFLDRNAIRLKHFFHLWGPATAARRMKPGFAGQVVDPLPRPQVLDAVYDYLEKNDVRFASTALPVLHDHPPKFYQDVMINKVRYLGIHQVRLKFDEVNTAFALEDVIKSENRLMYVWLPGVDERCHGAPRGQWGPARKNLYLVDRHIGRMIEKLKREGISEKTYMVLYADHGHIGGKDFINQSFDITHDFFYKGIKDLDGDRLLDADSGLGFNVRWVQHDQAFHREHLDRGKEDFMAVSNMGYGVAVTYLPYKSKYTRNWSKPNSYYDLTHYDIHPELQPVNILDRLLRVDLGDKNKYPGVVSSKPIDLIIVRVAQDAVFIENSQGLQALIEKKATVQGKRAFQYRYRVITDFDQDKDGNNTFKEVAEPADDPLGYLSSPSFAGLTQKDPNWMKNFHTAQQWLEATKETQYPDAVVAFVHFATWDGSIKDLENRYVPDFAVSPKKGWSFQTDQRLATDHGYPLYDSMRIPILITGPNIKKGTVVTTPRRIIDILPTSLDMLGLKYDPESIDGRSITGIYEGGVPEGPVLIPGETVGFYTDRGLPIEYEEQPEELGANLHNIDNPYDLHFLLADVATLPGEQAFRITDDILDLFIPGKPLRPFNTAFDEGTGLFTSMPDNIFEKRFVQLMSALRIRQFNVTDGVSMIVFGNFITQENFLRANLIIDWLQDIVGDFNKLLGAPFFHFKKGLIPGGKYFNKYVIDYPQLFLERLRKHLLELAYRGFNRGTFYVEDGISASENAFKPKTWHTPELEGPLGVWEGPERHYTPEK